MLINNILLTGLAQFLEHDVQLLCKFGNYCGHDKSTIFDNEIAGNILCGGSSHVSTPNMYSFEIQSINTFEIIIE